MSRPSADILGQVLAASGEALVVIRVDHPDWPIVLESEPFRAVTGDSVAEQPFADVVEQLVGRDVALDVSQSIRSRQETSFPVEIAGRDYLLVLKPLGSGDAAGAAFYCAFWRGGAGAGSALRGEMHQALLRAKRDLKDLSRQDRVTGLLDERAFREILKHDWAVAAREKSTLALVVFELDDFDAYVDVFGQHAADTCLRRVGRAVRRCLRRASDVVGRLEGAQIAVLSHASAHDQVRDFARRIASSVRELGLHHPRSSVARFVTVSYRVAAVEDPAEIESANRFLDELLAGPADQG